jgi:hypothetical protein
MWMTAQGNEQKVTKAKDLLINSIVGLIILSLLLMLSPLLLESL